MQTILVADDDPHIRDVLDFSLQQAGFAVLHAENGLQALTLIREHLPALIILDITMPELDGTEVCRQIRQQGGEAARLPVLFLSSRTDEIDRVLGLELGGDDYVTKPFSPRELVARVKAVLRRMAPAPVPDLATSPASAQNQPPASRQDLGMPQEQGGASTPPNEVLTHGRLRLDTGRFEAWWDREKIDLTATEFGILRTLIRRPGFVFSRDQLMDGAYNLQHFVSDRTIDSHVRRVRSKFSALDAAPIETVHGLGYRLGTCV